MISLEEIYLNATTRVARKIKKLIIDTYKTAF